MLGFCGVYGPGTGAFGEDALAASINLAKTALTHPIHADEFLAVSSWLENAALKGPRHFENDDFILQFAGDVVGVAEVP